MAADFDNVGMGGATVTIGSDLGAITDGVHTTPTFDIYKVENIEGYMTPPQGTIRRTSETYTIVFTLLEATFDNLRIGWDITNTEAAGPPVTIEFGGDSATPNERTLVVTGVTMGATKYTRTLTFTKAFLSAGGELVFSDYQHQSIPCTFEALYDTTNSRLGQFSDATS